VSRDFFRKCVSYWAARICESDIGVDWSDAMDRCWRCGRQTKSLQRCHVVAKQFGGKLVPENVVLLCRDCHDEAPDVTDASEVWRWIKETRPSYYGTLNAERAFAIVASRGVDVSKFNKDRFLEIADAHVGVHLMQNGAGAKIKPSSLAWAIEQACMEAS